jgi:hypothetical protein
LDNRPAGKPISNNDFENFKNEIDLCTPFSCEKEDGIVYWCAKPNLSRAAINEVFRNPTMATVSNFTLSHTGSKCLNEMSNAMGINFRKSVKVCCNLLADPNNLHNDDYSWFFYRICVECIEFLMQHPTCREHMMYAPATEFDDDEQLIHSQVKSCYWWWNDLVR